MLCSILYESNGMQSAYPSSSSDESALWICSYDANTIAPVGMTFKMLGSSPL